MAEIGGKSVAYNDRDKHTDLFMLQLFPRELNTTSMELVIVIFLVAGAITSVILSAFITLITKRTWARFGLLAAILFLGGCLLGYTIYRFSAKEVARDKSPDGRYYVVIYRLPNFSMTPGSGSDGAAIGQLFDASGRLLHQADIEMLGRV